MNVRGYCAGLVAAVALCFQVAPAAADEVVVYSTVAAKGALDLIGPEFEKASGHTVKFRFATAAELKSEIEKGAPFDVALLTVAGIDDLLKQSRLAAGSKVAVFKSGVGVAVKKGAATPSVATPEDLKAVALAAKAIALSTQGASGPIVRRAFEKLGISEATNAKIVLVSDMTAPEAVAQGRADLALTQISEILDTPGAQLLGGLPADLQSFSAFAAGTAAAGKSPAAAAAFLKTLGTPAAQAHMKARGLVPE